MVIHMNKVLKKCADTQSSKGAGSVRGKRPR